MAYCGKCGVFMNDDATFCPACGAANEPGAPNHQGSFESAAGAQASSFAQPASEILEGKTMSILAYLSILVLIPVFAGGSNKFTRYHANQGLVLFITEVLVSIVMRILWAILPFGLIYSLVSIIYSLCGLAFLALTIIGILNAVNGKTAPLPVIGSYQLLK